MKLPKKCQGEFDCIEAIKAMRDGKTVEVYNILGHWVTVDPKWGVHLDGVYRLKAREFPRGWYHYHDSIIYRNTHDEWKCVGTAGACGIDEDAVGEMIK